MRKYTKIQQMCCGIDAEFANGIHFEDMETVVGQEYRIDKNENGIITLTPVETIEVDLPMKDVIAIEAIAKERGIDMEECIVFLLEEFVNNSTTYAESNEEVPQKTEEMVSPTDCPGPGCI